MSDKFVITKVLMSLPEDYKHFISAWESAPDDKQTYDNLVARLLIEEERIKEKGGPTPSTAFVAKKVDKKSVECYKCHRLGHYQSECRYNNNNNFGNSKDNRSDMKCYFCNKPGHIKSQCRFKKGKEKESNAFIVNSVFDEQLQKSQWLVDSGASEHMCCDYKLFNSYLTVKDKSVIVGNGTKINVKGCGQVALQVWNGSEWIDTTIDNVLHVPELKTNLFSVNCATSRGYVIVMEENKCKFYKQNKVMAIAERRGSMYYLDFRYFNAYTANLADVCCDLSEWHEKLAHQNIVYVKDVLKKNNINIKNANVQTCESCLKGKIHRLPYPVSNNVTSRVCEIIHADTCGPMEKPSIGGSRYFVVFKDEYSKYRQVFFVKTKDEIKSCIKNFISQAENETGNKIKIFRSDNGTEFINKEVREVFQNKGIIHQTSVTFTPEQNGVAERENRILVEAARTMLYAKDPISLWAESVNTAAYVINRTGKSSIEGKSPYELWSSKSYDINNLKIFGTTVYVHIPKEKRHKWDAKGEKGIMVGYGETTKGYRVYFPQKSEVETKRDIVFVNNSPVKPIQQCETINYIEDSVEVPATVEVGAQVEDTSAAGMSSSQSPTMGSDDSQRTMQSDSEGSVYEPSDSDECGEVVRRDVDPKNKRIRKQTVFYNCNNVMLDNCEPKTYREAMNSPDACKWQEAIQRELKTLKNNNTWSICDMPDNEKVISSKWVFKIKRNNSNIQYKARLVARGFEQNDILNLNDVYAPVAKLSTFRLFLAIATKSKLYVYQMDVTGAFLYGEIEENAYISLPDGAYDNDKNIVKLNKSLYGLKKSPKYWNEKFNSIMIREGFKRSKCDPCLYSKCNDSEQIYVLLYVDDMLMFGSNEEHISNLKSMLNKEFEMKDLGLISEFLGINVKQNLKTNVTELCQKNYLENVLKRFHMYDCKPISTPMDQNFNCKELENDKCKGNIENICREIVGCLMYAASGTRPDICVAVSILSRYQDCASNMLLINLKRVLRYIKHTLNYRLVYKCDDSNLVGFCDADWGGDLRDRKSTTGYCFMYSNCLISWCSKKQSTVSLSSAESEYVAMSMAGSEACWIANVLCDFNVSNVCPAIMHCDNQAAITIANTNSVKRLKHIDIKYHYIRELIENKKICIQYVTTRDQIADMLTKSLNGNTLLKFVKLCGMNM